MPDRPSGSQPGLFGAMFAERRVYIRTAEQTRYLVIRPSTQVACLLATAALIGWTAFTTSAFVSNAVDGRAANIRIEALTEAYEARIAAHEHQQAALEEQLNQADARRDQITERLSVKQAQLVQTANDLRAASGELEVLRVEYETMVGRHREDTSRIASLESQLGGLERALAEAETSRDNVEGAFESLTAAIDTVIAERDAAAGKITRLDGELVQMKTRIGRYEDRQERLVSQLEEAAKVSLTGLETLFGRVPVNLDKLMSQARRDFSGAGGPFIPVSAEVGDEDDMRIAALMQDLETVSLMRFAADRMPLGNPAPGARFTSGFGVREDPRGRGRSIHNGFDLAAPRGTAVYATADGVVIFAGRERGYGNVVKVRHAFGFETFYAHNSRLRVKVGQRVSRGDRIADMGSTGRSTGNHLHYEVRLDNKPINPRKFIEAPRNVL